MQKNIKISKQENKAIGEASGWWNKNKESGSFNTKWVRFDVFVKIEFFKNSNFCLAADWFFFYKFLKLISPY